MSAITRRFTTSVEFFPCNGQGTALFAVCPGVPAQDALELASCFLASADAALQSSLQERDDGVAWASLYLMQMAKAIVDASSAPGGIDT